MRSSSTVLAKLAADQQQQQQQKVRVLADTQILTENLTHECVEFVKDLESTDIIFLNAAIHETFDKIRATQMVN